MHWLKTIPTVQLFLVIVTTGLLILWFDTKRMEQHELNREATLSRIIGWTYVIVPVLVWLSFLVYRLVKPS